MEIKKITTTIAIIIIIITILYGFCSFYMLDFNPTQWYENTRYIFAVCSFISIIVIVGRRHN